MTNIKLQINSNGSISNNKTNLRYLHIGFWNLFDHCILLFGASYFHGTYKLIKIM